MAIYKRDNISKVYDTIKNGKVVPVYLIVGDRFLSQQAADKLVESLLPCAQKRRQNLHLIDGSREFPLNTLTSLKTFSLFPGRQVFKVSGSLLFSKPSAKSFWTKAVDAAKDNDFELAGRYLGEVALLGKIVVERYDDLTDLPAQKWKSLFGFVKPKGNMAWVEQALAAGKTSDNAASAESGDDAAGYYMEAFEAGIPENNILVLLTEEVDKRKKFFKFLKKEGTVLDLSVASGTNMAAKKEKESVLRELITKTLAEFGKKMAPQAIPVLLERVGYHPVAVVKESEKLALFIGDESVIKLQDVSMVGRTREDVIYELTESYSDKNLTNALLISSRMLESGIHPLVLISGLRNHLRKLLLVCSFRMQPSPVFVEGMSYTTFEKGYLVQLKEEKGELLKTLPKNPYALFMLFKKAGKHSMKQLLKGLSKLLEAEFRMKSSPMPGQLVFENFLFEMLTRKR